MPDRDPVVVLFKGGRLPSWYQSSQITRCDLRGVRCHFVGTWPFSRSGVSRVFSAECGNAAIDDQSDSIR